MDKDTGKELRSIDIPNGVQGVPTVFEVDGREYVTFCATGGYQGANAATAPGTEAAPPAPKMYITLALPQKKS